MIITRCMVNKDYYTAIKYQDDDDAINFVKDPEERAVLQAQHEAADTTGGLDWKAIFTFGMASTAPPTSLPKPHTGSGTGSYSSLANDEVTPLVGASSPPVEEIV